MSLARRELSPARLGRNLRLLLARRPWLRWLAVALIAAAAGIGVQTQIQSLDTARARWSDQRRVPVATTATSPGEAISWEWRSLPAVAVPTDVAADISAGALARQHIGIGEIVVSADLTIGAGPAAGARPGHVVVPVNDPLVAGAAVGLDIAIYSEGLTLAGRARIVHVEADVVFVEVPAAEAPLVAAAAQTHRASVAFLAPP
jgi:hypothetical protein